MLNGAGDWFGESRLTSVCWIVYGPPCCRLVVTSNHFTPFPAIKILTPPSYTCTEESGLFRLGSISSTLVEMVKLTGSFWFQNVRIHSLERRHKCILVVANANHLETLSNERGRWVAQYASTRLDGDALLWYYILEDETEESWRKLRSVERTPTHGPDLWVWRPDTVLD